MNKYFKKEKIIKELKEELKISLIIVKDIEEQIQILKNECNHTYENEKTSIIRLDNTGPGDTIYFCEICEKKGNWIWAGKHL